MSFINLTPSTYFHVYNHANGHDDLFIDRHNYLIFKSKWKKYIHPIADSIAYCLMPNHFHYLIQIKDLEDLQGLKNFGGSDISKYLSQQFSNLFNSYTKYLNLKYDRFGSLFAPNFRRKLVDNEVYLKVLIGYIHLNPVNHGFARHPEEWEFNSYHEFNNESKIWKSNNHIKNIFGSFQEYLSFHKSLQEINQVQSKNGNLQGL